MFFELLKAYEILVSSLLFQETSRILDYVPDPDGQRPTNTSKCGNIDRLPIIVF